MTMPELITDLDVLRTWPNERLIAHRDALAVLERQVRLARACTDRVIDERGITGDQDLPEWVQARDQVRPSKARTEADVVRRLDELPAVRAAAEAGRLSKDQLEHIVELATPTSDKEWAERGQRLAPSDLARLARKQRVVNPEDEKRRDAAKELRWWRSRDGHWLELRGRIPDIDSHLVERVLEHEIEQQKPAPGEAWAPRARRGAQALVDIFRAYSDASTGDSKRTRRWQPKVVVHVGSAAQATVNGTPISLAAVLGLLDDGAPVRTVFDDDKLAPRTGDDIPARLREYVLARDVTCRVPGCGRAYGLEIHHIVPRSWGGRTDKHNVVLVCTTHHHRLVPHGRWVLEGDPELPDGLKMRRIDRPGDGIGDARAGPAA